MIAYVLLGMQVQPMSAKLLNESMNNNVMVLRMLRH